MEALKCPNCGGQIIKAEDDVFFCPYCGIGIEPNVKKTKLNIEIKSDEKKVIEHKDKAKTIEAVESLIWTILFIVVMGGFIIYGLTQI